MAVVQPARQPAVAAALARSRFARLPQASIDALTEGALLLEVPAGGMPWQQGHHASAAVIVSGLLRSFHTTHDGRQVTVRYARAGELLGIATLYAPNSGVLGLQALTPVKMLILRAEAVRALAEKDAQIANVMLEEVSVRLVNFLEELAGNTFGSMRQRVVRHLLDLAPGPPGQRLPLF